MKNILNKKKSDKKKKEWHFHRTIRPSLKYCFITRTSTNTELCFCKLPSLFVTMFKIQPNPSNNRISMSSTKKKRMPDWNSSPVVFYRAPCHSLQHLGSTKSLQIPKYLWKHCSLGKCCIRTMHAFGYHIK